jgi:hypothetical protein
MEVEVARLFDLPAAALAPLVAESEQDGWRFVRRLADKASWRHQEEPRGQVTLNTAQAR